MNIKPRIKSILESVFYGHLETVCLKKGDYVKGALHIIIPHRANWPLTEACVNAFLRLTEKTAVVTVVSNFDKVPDDLGILKNSKVSVLWNKTKLLSTAVDKLIKENGSKSNAYALDAALHYFPHYEWAFMAHNDSAPLVRAWDRVFFDAMENEKVIGNFYDKVRIHAAHCSGTLFSQKEIVEKGVSLAPEFINGEMRLDVGDRVTEVLHDSSTGHVKTLPNTINTPELVSILPGRFPKINVLAEHRSAISFDPTKSFPVFCHFGRGTPRSTGDAAYKKTHVLPVDHWIDLINSIN